jgi:hypothetical protein
MEEDLVSICGMDGSREPGLMGSFYVCIPGILVAGIWTYKAEMAHKAHTEHLK